METELSIITYRQTLSTGTGKVFLADLLAEAGFFDIDLSSPEEIAVENFVKLILCKAGLYPMGTLKIGKRTPEQIKERRDYIYNYCLPFVNKLFEIPVNYGKE